MRGLNKQAEAVAMLADHALTSLYMADQDEGCCNVCCAPCNALLRLLDAGLLDKLIGMRRDVYETDTWDIVNQRVDREFLQRAWRMTSCHDA